MRQHEKMIMDTNKGSNIDPNVQERIPNLEQQNKLEGKNPEPQNMLGAKKPLNQKVQRIELKANRDHILQTVEMKRNQDLKIESSKDTNPKPFDKTSSLNKNVPINSKSDGKQQQGSMTMVRKRHQSVSSERKQQRQQQQQQQQQQHQQSH